MFGTGSMSRIIATRCGWCWKGAGIGESYNIGGLCEMTNLQVVSHLCSLLDELFPNSQFAPHASLLPLCRTGPGMTGATPWISQDQAGVGLDTQGIVSQRLNPNGSLVSGSSPVGGIGHQWGLPTMAGTTLRRHFLRRKAPRSLRKHEHHSTLTCRKLC